YLDIGSEEKENEPDIPPDEEGLAASQSTEPEETYMDVPQDESTADESVVDDFEGQEQMTQEDIEALLMGRDEEAPEEVENLDNMFEDSEGLLESDEDESSVLSQDDFEAEPESEPTPQEAEPESSVEAEAEFVQQAELEDEAISEPDVEPEIAAAVEEEAEELKAEEQPVEEAIEEPAEEKTVEKEPDVPQPESTASDDQMMNKEELSAILREEEQNEDAEKALDSLAEQTEEIARKLDGFEEEETGSQSQFQPGTNVNGQGEEIESTEDDPNSRKLNPKLIKPLIFTGIGAVVIMVLLYFFPMGTGKDETELALEHISEAWTWERNPDHESSVKYRIYAPGASITLSTLGGLRSTALAELDSSPLKSHYTKLEKNAEIERFRLLGDVRYVEAKDAKNSRMLHFDYFFKDQEGRFHLKRSAYFGVSELVLKLEITSITEDPDLTSESEVSQNLNQLFMDVLGISELGYLPEHEIGEDIKDFEKNTQFLAKRVILLDK
ncbi:hypothetical protein HOF92_11900, partial [bacterium]|nr:hypothetical protein [bacterium]